MTGITRLGTPATNDGSVQFQVNFSEAVAGVDASDFQVVCSGSVSSGAVSVAGSGSSYTVTVDGVAGAGDHGLELIDDDTIRDILSNSAQSHALGGPGAGHMTGGAGVTAGSDTVLAERHGAVLLLTLNRPDRLNAWNGELEARLIKRLGQSAHRILGVIRKANRQVRVEPVDRKSKESLLLLPAEGDKLSDGDLVLAIDTDGHSLVKRYYREARRIRFEAINRSKPPTFTPKATIIGLVVGVIRQF